MIYKADVFECYYSHDEKYFLITTFIWSFGSDIAKLPQEIVIDMGGLLKISGFIYVLQQMGNALNLIAYYEFYTSKDVV